MEEERTPPEMRLVVAPEDARCLICQKHVGPFMVEAESVHFGRVYFCQFCGRDMWDALKESEEESDG